MAIVTFTTDFGNDSHNLAALKGAILSKKPEYHFTGISNTINNYDIEHAAYVLANSFNFFPQDTIHLILVNLFYAKKLRFLILRKNGYYFIAPDNGVLSLLFKDLDAEELYYVPYGNTTGDFYHILSGIISGIEPGTPLEEKFEPAVNVVKKISLQPVFSGDSVRATVMFIDKFGNAVTNIKKDFFEQAAGGRKFKLYYSPKNHIDTIHAKYSDVPFGEELCLFNSAGYLEIAVYMDSAEKILGLHKNFTVNIVFE